VLPYKESLVRASGSTNRLVSKWKRSNLSRIVRFVKESEASGGDTPPLQPSRTPMVTAQPSARELTINKKNLRGLSPRENYTDRVTFCLSVKLVPTFAVRECHVFSVTDPVFSDF
jgi:hypothetical protein